MLKQTIRSILRRVLPATTMRGRHAVADSIGKWATPDPPIEVVDVNGMRIEFDHRLTTCRHMYYGIYESSFISFLQRTLRPGNVFFDLGANIGYISAIAHGVVTASGRVIAFEPSRICYDQIMTNNSKLPRGVQLFNTAIMHRNGTHPFMDTPRVISAGFSVLMHERDPGPDDKVYTVDAITIDQAASNLGVDRIACVKMDIEGAELIALQGAHKMLSEHRIEHLLIETTNLVDISRVANKEIVQLLTGHGYSPFLPDHAGKLRSIELDLTRTFRYDVIWKYA